MTLHGYQQEGVDWLVEMHHKGLNCILADEMVRGRSLIFDFEWMASEFYGMQAATSIYQRFWK